MAQRFATVIGVVEDVRYTGAATLWLPDMYFMYRKFDPRMTLSTLTLLVRPAGATALFAGEQRSMVLNIDHTMAAGSLMTLEQRHESTSLARPRFYALLLAGFAGVALLVTGVGLFAVLS